MRLTWILIAPLLSISCTAGEPPAAEEASAERSPGGKTDSTGEPSRCGSSMFLGVRADAGWMEVPDAPDLRLMHTPFTVEACVRGRYGNIQKRTYHNGGWSLSFNDEWIVATIFDATSRSVLGSLANRGFDHAVKAELEAARWHHIAWTFDPASQTSSVFVDGTLVDRRDARRIGPRRGHHKSVGPNDGQPLLVGGARINGFAEDFRTSEADFDDVRVSSGIRYGAEATSSTPEVLAHYDFDRDAIRIGAPKHRVTDVSANGHTATLADAYLVPRSGDWP